MAYEFTEEDLLAIQQLTEAEVKTLLVEEDEMVGNVTFHPQRALDPDTAVTAYRHRRKLEKAYMLKKQAEAERKRKEQEEAARRIREQEAKKLKAQQEQKRKEAERRQREEEEQRKKMQGGLEIILTALTSDTSKESICIQGIELSNIQIRLISKALEKNTSCRCLDLSRRNLQDADGVALAKAMESNTGLDTFMLEGNNFGVKTAKAFADAIKVNESLRTLNLEANNLTMSGNDQSGAIALAEAFEHNDQLLVLNLTSNKITSEASDQWVSSLAKNKSLTMLDLSGNDVPVLDARALDKVIAVNRHELHVLRKNERRERNEMYEAEYDTRTFLMEVEAKRMELEAVMERRMVRMQQAHDKWELDFAQMGQDLAQEMAEIEQAYVERKGAKKKGKKK